MQTVLLPMKFYNQLDQIVRDFLWGDSGNKKAWHMISWNVVTKPKTAAGLGLTSAHEAI